MLQSHAGVREAVVTVDTGGADTRLVAYVAGEAEPGELRRYLGQKLPGFMVPRLYVPLEALPRNTNGKVDRSALPAPEGAAETVRGEYVAPTTEAEAVIARVWQEILGREQVGAEDNFFDLGGSSLLILQMQRKLRQALGREVAVVSLLRYPTVRTLAASFAETGPEASEEGWGRGLERLSSGRGEAGSAGAATGGEEELSHGRSPFSEVNSETKTSEQMTDHDSDPRDDCTWHGDIRDGDIAVIGMACRFPGADDPDAFWRNLRQGVESISRFSTEELRAAGVPEELFANPAYVPAAAVLEEPGRFDAAFFGFSKREAEITDPQHRLFLECAWEALESAGIVPERAPGPVGVFAGAGLSSYLRLLFGRPELVARMGGFRIRLGNDKDFLPTWTSYKLNLKGPSIGVQSACSTSLVAVHLACQSLLGGECDLALAGGVSVTILSKAGYLHQEGGILSPDGRCRPFDAGAAGTVGGCGAGVVLLRPLADALEAGDPVRAVLRGSAINNDGSLKVGFTAPSVDGQAKVVAEALAVAEVEPESNRLRGGPRHRHGSRGSGRNHRPGRSPGRRRSSDGALRDRLGEEQSRASGRGRGSRRAPQDGARPRPPGAASEPPLRNSQSQDRPVGQRARGGRYPAPVADRRWATPGPG